MKANFRAADGIETSSLSGVALISALATLLFAALNSVRRAYDRLLVVLCFLPAVQYFFSTALFSSSRSGGACFTILLRV